MRKKERWEIGKKKIRKKRRNKKMIALVNKISLERKPTRKKKGSLEKTEIVRRKGRDSYDKSLREMKKLKN